MNDKNKNTPAPADDQWFDLLADGQLDETRRHELLSGLDDRPGGWRRCALAFLEAQSWREAMDALAGAPQTENLADAQPVTPVAATKAPRKIRWRSHVNLLLGMAASFLLAVGLTSLARDMQRGGAPMGGGTDMASMLPVVEYEPSAQPGTTPRPMPGVNQNQRQEFHLVGLPATGTDGKPKMIGLPAVSRDRLDEQWLRNMPSAIPADVAQSLQQAGHEVQSSRQLLPFRMKDGRRLVVPVDQLDVHYASDSGYQ